MKDEVPCGTVSGRVSGLTYDHNGYFCGFKVTCQETEAEYSFYCIAVMIQNLAHDAVRKGLAVEVQFEHGKDGEEGDGGWREFRRMTIRDVKSEGEGEDGQRRLTVGSLDNVYGPGPRPW